MTIDHLLSVLATQLWFFSVAMLMEAVLRREEKNTYCVINMVVVVNVFSPSFRQQRYEG